MQDRTYAWHKHTHRKTIPPAEMGGFSLRRAVVAFGFVDFQKNILRDETQQQEVKMPYRWMKICLIGWQPTDVEFGCVTYSAVGSFEDSISLSMNLNVSDAPLFSHLALSALIYPTILTTQPWNFDNESCKSSEWFSGSPDPTMMYKNSAEVCHNLRFLERYDTQRRKLKFPVSMNYLVELSHLGCTLCRSQTSLWMPHLEKLKEQKWSGSYFRIFFVSPFFMAIY